jgi:hypothetical protein
MRRIRIALASASIAALVATALVGAAPAAAKWKKLQCVPGEMTGTRVCLWRDTNDTNRARGRYINNSGVDLRTKGVFWRYNTSETIGCAEAITEAGTTSTCIRTLPRGTWYVGAYTWYGSEYVGFTATNEFRFGF